MYPGRNRASAVCLTDLHQCQGFFAPEPPDAPPELVVIISCPTIAAPEKILRRVRAGAGCRLERRRWPFALVTLRALIKKYSELIKGGFPDIIFV
jgi:hypothetical protein